MLLIIAIVVAAGCLAVGLLTGQAVLCWVALAVSLVAALYFGFLVLRRRRDGTRDEKVESPEKAESVEKDEPAPNVEPAPEAESVEKDEPAANTEPVASTEPVANTAKHETGPAPAAGGGPDIVHWVKVARGRRRFHLESCSLLEGKTVDEIGLDEAQDEGFTACTKCIPDLATVTGPASEAR